MLSLDGTAAAAVLDGEAGIGKTAIWTSAVARAAEQGHRVLSCRAAEAEASLPFVALGDLLDPVLDDVLPALAEPQRRALEVALARVEPTEALGRLAASRAVLAALRALAAREPVLLAIDDVQWLDEPTADVLVFAVRRLTHAPVRLLVARRSEHAEPAPLDLGRTYPSGRLELVRVGPLAPGDLDALLRSALGLRLPRPRLLELHRVTGGNPFYALEIARAAGRRAGGDSLPVPESVGDLLRARLAELSKDARATLVLAAAAWYPTDRIVERAAGTSAGLAESVENGVLELDGRRLRFAHPLLASVAYESAPPWERREAHRRLAAVLDDPQERARHLALATDEPDDAIAAELEDAARLAVGRGAPESAAQLAESAARLTPGGADDARRRRLAAAADHHVASGDPDRGRALLERLIHELLPGPERADLLCRLADAVPEIADSIRLCEQALEEVPGDAAASARIHTALGVFTWVAGDVTRSVAHLRASARLAEETGDELLIAVSLGELCYGLVVLGEPFPRAELERAVELERSVKRFPPYLRPSFQLGVLLLYTDALDEARPLLRAELERVDATGDESTRVGVLFRLAELELRAGNWAEAAERAGSARALALQAAAEQEQGVAQMVHALVQAHLGNADEAREAALAALELAEAGGDRVISMRARGVLGFLELSLGEAARALEWLSPARRDLQAAGIGELSIQAVVQNELEALVEAGRLDDALETIAWVEEKGRRADRAWHAAVAARGRALVAAARGDLEDAAGEVARALRAHERLPQPFELARTLLVQGQVERRAKRRASAREALTRALELFDSLGAALWAERTAAELARIPGRTRGSGELTETERRVAELVAQGLANKQVASRLFISVRAVEANLSRVYAKLGVRSRTELASRLGRDAAS